MKFFLVSEERLLGTASIMQASLILSHTHTTYTHAHTTASKVRTISAAADGSAAAARVRSLKDSADCDSLRAALAEAAAEHEAQAARHGIAFAAQQASATATPDTPHSSSSHPARLTTEGLLQKAFCSRPTIDGTESIL